MKHLTTTNDQVDCDIGVLPPEYVFSLAKCVINMLLACESVDSLRPTEQSHVQRNSKIKPCLIRASLICGLAGNSTTYSRDLAPLLTSPSALVSLPNRPLPLTMMTDYLLVCLLA